MIKVEGVTVWNWKEIFTINDNAENRDKLYYVGVYQLSISYKDNKNKWQRYKSVSFSNFTCITFECSVLK